MQTIHPHLINQKTMLVWSRRFRCLLHALNKCFERAFQASMGTQGLGNNTCVQMMFASITMFRKIIEECGLELYARYHQIIVDMILQNEEWQREAGENFKHQFNEWWSLMNSGDIDNVTDTLSKGMRNLQLPVFTRWHTIIPSIKAFIKNYVVVYFFSVAVK